MKFVYEFRTSDNVRREGVVSAPNRDAAYHVLKEKGIRPSRLLEAPGLLNKVLGKGKRWIAIVVLTALVIASALAIRSANQKIQSVEVQLSSGMPRHQIADIPADWAAHIDAIFPDAVDRILARYALPGIKSAATPQVSGDVHAPWAEVLKQVVAGMRDESRAFLSLGKSVEELRLYLEERQNMEATYREQIIRRVHAGELSGERADAILSAMGLRKIF